MPYEMQEMMTMSTDEIKISPSNSEVLRTLEVLRRAVGHLRTSFKKHYKYRQYNRKIIENIKNSKNKAT